MNAMEIIITGLVALGGILVVTFTTTFCLVRHAREKWARQLFDAYVHSPHKLEAWLVRGALDQVEHTLALGNSGRR
jgi:hypothetical protein